MEEAFQVSIPLFPPELAPTQEAGHIFQDQLFGEACVQYIPVPVRPPVSRGSVTSFSTSKNQCP